MSSGWLVAASVQDRAIFGLFALIDIKSGKNSHNWRACSKDHLCCWLFETLIMSSMSFHQSNRIDRTNLRKFPFSVTQCGQERDYRSSHQWVIASVKHNAKLQNCLKIILTPHLAHCEHQCEPVLPLLTHAIITWLIYGLMSTQNTSVPSCRNLQEEPPSSLILAFGHAHNWKQKRMFVFLIGWNSHLFFGYKL